MRLILILVIVVLCLCISLIKLVEPFENLSIEQMNTQYQLNIIALNKNSDNLDSKIQDLVVKQIPSLQKTLDANNQNLAMFKDGYNGKINVKKLEDLKAMDDKNQNCIIEQGKYTNEKARFDNDLAKINTDLYNMKTDMPNLQGYYKNAKDENVLLETAYDKATEKCRSMAN